MKRQKRDLAQRAHARGYAAGLYGKNKDTCPHQAEPQRQEWLNGWREGRADQWDGLSGVAAAEKMAM